MNSVDSKVQTRILRKSNIHCDSSPWIEIVTKHAGSPVMPSGAWNGIKLTEIIKNRVFVAHSDELSEIDIETGEKLWSVETGNTSIHWIMTSRSNDGLIVFNSYYQFEHPNGLANISFVSLSGREQWRSPLPSGEDIFASNPRYEGGLLKSSSWNGFDCTIDQATGEIVDRQFTK